MVVVRGIEMFRFDNILDSSYLVPYHDIEKPYSRCCFYCYCCVEDMEFDHCVAISGVIYLDALLRRPSETEEMQDHCPWMASFWLTFIFLSLLKTNIILVRMNSSITVQSIITRVPL
mmetsp:Transcript_15745/g.23174  ORF Transcript_15745/g.23174 Transcript_15745/m.23174 type:complete len:117 (+) Transcript_15745:1380-1730(+)